MTNALANAMINETTLTRTTNGERAYTTTNSALLDMFSKIGASRNVDANGRIKMLKEALNEDVLLATRLMFHVRDVRGGMGERDTFRILLKYMANNHTEIVRKNLAQIAVFGRWDDMLELFGTKLETEAIDFMMTQLTIDLETETDKSISLLAKWLPSINTSSKESVKMAEKIAKRMDLTHRQYRKMLSMLRDRLNIVERKMSAKQWDDIKYEIVGSRSHMIYSKAFKKHDATRFEAYKTALAAGKAKINAVGVFPYELVQKDRTRATDSAIVNAQWKAMPPVLDECALAMVDVSESMTWFTVGPNTPVQGLDVAVAMGIYTAEKNKGPFKDIVLTFDSTPKIHSIKGNTLAEKYYNITRMGVGGSTNIEAAYNLILRIAVENNVEKKDMVKTLFIFSDMQFNSCTSNRDKRNIDVARAKFNDAGYDLPKIVFWNLDGGHSTSPAKVNDEGVVMVSGFSAELFKYVTKGTTPYQTMLETLNSARYQTIEV